MNKDRRMRFSLWQRKLKIDVGSSKFEQNRCWGSRDIAKNVRAFVEKTLVMLLNQGDLDMVTPQEPPLTSMELLPTSIDSSYLTGPYADIIEHHSDLIRPKGDFNWPQNDYIWLHSDLIWLPVTTLGSLGGPLSCDFVAFSSDLSGPQTYFIGLSIEIFGPLCDSLGPISDHSNLQVTSFGRPSEPSITPFA